MIIDDLDLRRIPCGPYEANPPLIVDSNAVLTTSPSFQGFQAVGRRDAKIFQGFRAVQHAQFSPRYVLNVPRQSARDLTTPDSRRFLIPECVDHATTITLYVI